MSMRAVPPISGSSRRSCLEVVVNQRPHRHHLWMVASALLIAAGMVGALFAAGLVAGNANEKSQKAFKTSAGEIAASLELAIQHDNDLVDSGSAVVFAGDPVVSNTDFVRWAKAAQVLERYPELQDFGDAVIVPAAQLKAFAARAVLDPWSTLSEDGTFNVVPPGVRSFYCLGRVGMIRNPESGAPAGFDFCASELGKGLLHARDSGLGFYGPFTIGKIRELGILDPVYRVTRRLPRLRSAATRSWGGSARRSCPRCCWTRRWRVIPTRH